MNSSGLVIGVNTATIPSAQGLCFAVSSNLAAYVAGKLIMEGKVKRAWLGIAGQLVNLSERMIAANKLTKKTGVYIFEVMADQPAYNNEIRTGDILVAFNSVPVGSVDDPPAPAHGKSDRPESSAYRVKKWKKIGDKRDTGRNSISALCCVHFEVDLFGEKIKNFVNRTLAFYINDLAVFLVMFGDCGGFAIVFRDALADYLFIGVVGSA